MSKITNRVLTAKNQGLPAGKQKNARENIGVSVKDVSVDGNVVSFDTDSGEKTYTGGLVSDVGILGNGGYETLAVTRKDGTGVSINLYDKRQVDALVGDFGSFLKVPGTGADNHPDVSDPSPKIIYLVEVPGTPEPDHCLEWIWEEDGGNWECIGTTSISVDHELDPSSDNPVSNGAVCIGLDEKTDKTDFVDAVNALNNAIALKANQADLDAEHAYAEGEVSRLDDKIDTLDTKVDTEVGRLDGDIDTLDTKVDTEVTRLDDKIDTLDTKVDTEVGRLDGDIDTLDTKVDTEVGRLDQAVTDEHTYTVTQVNRLDQRIDDLCLILTDATGVVSGTTMTVSVANGTYTRFDVPAAVKTLLVSTDDPATEGNVSRAMFEFTLPETTVLEDVRVVDGNENDRLSTAPMRWPGTVTYQGTITNGIATILGYSPVTYRGRWLSTDDDKILTTSTGKHIKYVLQ